MKTTNKIFAIFGMFFLALATVALVSAAGPVSANIAFEGMSNSVLSQTITLGDTAHVDLLATSVGVNVQSVKLELIGSTTTQIYSSPTVNARTWYLTSPVIPQDAGTYTLRFTATTAADSTGKTYTDTKELTLVVNPIDTTNPVVTITSPTAGAHASVTQALFTLSEDATCTYTIDTSAAVAMICGSSFTNQINGLNFADGAHTITVTATDAAGNTGSDSVTFMVSAGGDSQAPMVTITTPADGSVFNNAVTELFFHSEDSEGNIDSYWYSVDGGLTNSTAQTIVDGASTQITGLNSVNGTNTWTVYVADTFGNIGSATTSFTANASSNDVTAPTITVISPEADENSLDFHFEVEVDEQNVNVIYEFNGTNTTMTENPSLVFKSDELTFEDNETYNVTFYATDAAGNMASVTIEFTVEESSNSGSTEYDSYYHAEFVDQYDPVQPEINLTEEEGNSLNWFQRFINWLCRVFGLDEAY